MHSKSLGKTLCRQPLVTPTHFAFIREPIQNDNTRSAEQNGCRQRLEGYLSCQQSLVLAVA